MFRGGFLWRFLLTLLIVIVLAGVGVGVYRMGFAQGYQAHALISAAPSTGQGAGNGQGQVVPPAPYYPYGPWAYGYGPHFWGPGFGFFPFFPLFGFGFFLLMFFLVGGLVRLLLFRRFVGGPGHWHRPWREDEEQPAEKPGEPKP